MHEKIDAASRARAKPYEDKRHIESQKPTTACGFSENYLRNINIDYAEHYIRKKTGGYRKICSPNWALKAAQTQILHRIIYTERTHPYSFGFRKYKSIVDNARPHCDSAVVIKLDIENFFPSIKKNNVHAIFQVMGWSDQHSSILSNLCCWKGYLPQGAPTSPALSNIFLREFDEKLAKFAIRNKARYTRYADDMTFSLREDSSKKVGAIIKFVQNELSSIGLRLNMKKQKIRVLRSHQHQQVCGITVNTERPTLSRQKRRFLRAVRHRLENSKEATMTKEQLEGWESFNRMVYQNKRTNKKDQSRSHF